MGCGGSKLKGEPVADITAPPPVKVDTSKFTTPDYSTARDPTKKISHGDRAPDDLGDPSSRTGSLTALKKSTEESREHEKGNRDHTDGVNADSDMTAEERQAELQTKQETAHQVK